MRTLVTALAFGLAATSVNAASFDDPEWPCIQRKVVNISTGQMWAGPPIEDADLRAWRKVGDVAALAPVLAVRRTSQEEADALIADFAADAGADKSEKLKLLFAGTFALIERERTQIIKGIGRYAKTQTALSSAIEETQNEIKVLSDKADKTFDDEDRIEELEDKLVWDTRIFKDRQQSLTFVCETPVILERRAFSMARTIMGELE